MSELVFPHSIDAGTAMVANEVQSNFVAVANVVNGNLQGGSGSDGNLAANGITARELADAILLRGVPTNRTREGLANSYTELAVTPGAGLVLNYAAGTAWVRDDSGVLSTGALIPVTVTGSTVTVAANSSGNPRADRVILTMTGYGTGTVSVLQGTPNAATTIDNMTGAQAVPSDAIELARVLMTNGFAGPFVDHTSLRNVAPWSKPMVIDLTAASTLDFPVDSANDDHFIIEHQHVETSAFANLTLRFNGLSTGIYNSAAHEVQLQSTPAFSNANRGAYGGTAGFLNLTGNSAAAGGTHFSGIMRFGVAAVASARVGTGHAVASSVTGSGNQVMSSYNLAMNVSTSGNTVLHYVSAFPASGTITGRFIIERVPITSP